MSCRCDPRFRGETSSNKEPPSYLPPKGEGDTGACPILRYGIRRKDNKTKFDTKSEFPENNQMLFVNWLTAPGV